MTRTELFALAEACGWDPRRVRQALREYFKTPAGKEALARAPRVTVETVQIEADEFMTPEAFQEFLNGLHKGKVAMKHVGPPQEQRRDVIADLLEEVETERVRRGL